MTQIIPERVTSLLEPVDENSAIGEDLDPDLDPYLDLQMGLESGDPDYESSVQKASTILKEHSKHLQIMSWLAFSMLRVDGLGGFRDGLMVIEQALKQFGQELYPSKPKRRLAALRFLNREKRIQVVLKKLNADADTADPAVMQEIQALLGSITSCYEEQFSDQKADLSDLIAIVDDLQSTNGVEVSKPAKKINKEGKKEEPKTAPQPEEETQTEAEINETTDSAAYASENGSLDNDEGGHSIEELELEMPTDVEELLEAIAADHPAGEDIERTEDQEQMVDFMRLQSEMQKRSGNDYPLCVDLCKDILTNHSKHLRVATWLCIAWFRTEGLEGLKKGFLLMAKLLEQYNEQLFPLKKNQQSKIIQRLNSEPRLQMVDKVVLGHEKAEYHVSDDSIRELKGLPKPFTNKLHALKGQSFVGRESFLQKVAEEASPEAAQEHETALLQQFQVGKAGNEKIEYAVTSNAIYRLKQQGLSAQIVDALTSLQNNTYKGWSRCFDDLTLTVGENHAATYQTTFEAFLNKNINEILETEHAFERVKTVCTEQFAEAPPNLEVLSESISSVANKARDLQDIAVATLVEASEQAAQKEKTAREQSERREKNQVKKAASKKDESHSEQDGSGDIVSVSKLQIQWAEDAVNVMKKALLFYFEDRPKANQDDAPAEQKMTAPLEPRVYGMSRVFRWGNIQMLPADQTIEGPNETRQSYLKNPPEGLDINTQIQQIELDFLKQNEFLYWLDGQQLVVQALERLGEKGLPAAAEIKFHLAKLLSRFPDLPTLTFRDQKTPFASPETIVWIEEEVTGMLGGGKSVEKILPPIMGESYEEINTQYEKACEELPDNFAENARTMQRAIDLESRQKGRFLIGLNLANFYSLGKNKKIARAKFNELIAEISEFTVSDWEPALCVATWRSAFLNNQKLLQEEQSQIERDEIERQQRQLFELIARYDGVLAHQLIEYSEEK